MGDEAECESKRRWIELKEVEGGWWGCSRLPVDLLGYGSSSRARDDRGQGRASEDDEVGFKHSTAPTQNDQLVRPHYSEPAHLPPLVDRPLPAGPDLDFSPSLNTTFNLNLSATAQKGLSGEAG